MPVFDTAGDGAAWLRLYFSWRLIRHSKPIKRKKNIYALVFIKISTGNPLILNNKSLFYFDITCNDSLTLTVSNELLIKKSFVRTLAYEVIQIL